MQPCVTHNRNKQKEHGNIDAVLMVRFKLWCMQTIVQPFIFVANAVIPIVTTTTWHVSDAQ